MRYFKPGTLLLTALLMVSFLLVGTGISHSSTPADGPVISDVFRIAMLTGSSSINRTDLRYGLMGTDLGIMWDNGRGQVMFAFGDSYGSGWGGCGAGPRQADWRSNTLALSGDRSPENGLTFSTMIQNQRGHAGELLSSLKVDNQEETVIPTAGIAVGTRNYLHYMSVNHWGVPGEWFTNYGGLAYSDDNGQTWTKSPEARWQNTSDWSDYFQQVALVKSGDFVYMFGTPNGRFGNAYLARVPQNGMLNKASYSYWDGLGWQPGKETAAVPVVPGPVSELSVQYNTYFGRWIMVYLDVSRNALILRTSQALTGPWTGEELLVNGQTYRQLYGGFIHPWFNWGRDLYFTMAQWCAPDAPYNVSLMHASLNLTKLSGNLLSDGDFEEQTSREIKAPWNFEGFAGVDSDGNHSHSGRANAWLRSSGNLNGLSQTIALVPGKIYRLSAWLRTSGSLDGYFGVRTLSGKVIKESKIANSPEYTLQTLEFTAGDETLVQVFTGFQGNGSDSWLNLDDIEVLPD